MQSSKVRVGGWVCKRDGQTVGEERGNFVRHAQSRCSEKSIQLKVRPVQGIAGPTNIHIPTPNRPHTHTHIDTSTKTTTITGQHLLRHPLQIGGQKRGSWEVVRGVAGDQFK